MTTPDGGAAARKAFRGPASACLSLEIVIVPLGLLVMDKVEGGLTPAKVAWVVVLTVGMIVAIATFSRPWGLPLALGLQVLMLLGWVVSPSLGVLGLEGDIDGKTLRLRYTRLLRQYHPDHNGGDHSRAARLQGVVEAYQLLRKSPALA